MNIIADLHTHTVASIHAFSTLEDIVKEARKRGLKAVAITDHTSGLDGVSRIHYLSAMTTFVPRFLHGVCVIRGAESNIMDKSGRIDLTQKELKVVDLLIASVHRDCYVEEYKGDITEAYLNATENPYIDIFGHMGDPSNIFDHKEVIEKIKKYDKVVEVNSHSFIHRPGSYEICKDIITLCKKNEVMIAISSDSHSRWDVGNFKKGINLVKELNYPEELILNADFDRLCNFIKTRKSKDITKESREW